MKPKISIKLKQIDLRQYSKSNSNGGSSDNKQLIIDILTQLVEYTEKIIGNSSGHDKQKNQFRLTQFKKAIQTIRSYDGEITSGQQARQLNGIGKGISDRIDEILTTHTLSELSQQQKITSHNQLLNDLTSVTGIGEVHAQKLIDNGVISVKDLYEKVKQGTIKVTHHVEVGLKYYEDFKQKISYDEVEEIYNVIKGIVNKIYPDVIINICGSHRRHLPFSGDLDVLMTSNNIKTDDDLIADDKHYLKNIVKQLTVNNVITDDLTSQGDTKYMGVCKHPKSPIGRRIDIRFIPIDSYYPAVLYFTGSMLLNKNMRTIALQKGYTLNEYGLYRLVDGHKEQRIVVQTEKEIFDILGILYLDPIDRNLL